MSKTKKPTEKQQLWARYYYTPGSTSIGNGTESARRAGYAGNANCLHSVAVYNLRNSTVRNLKKQLQGVTTRKLEHNRETALSILDEALVIARAKNNEVSIVQACRELNAISNLHSSTLHTDEKETKELDARAEAEARRLADIRLREIGADGDTKTKAG